MGNKFFLLKFGVMVMKEKYIFAVLILIITTLFIGCTEQKMTTDDLELISESLNTVALKINDLPDGYSVQQINETNKNINNVVTKEYLEKHFSFSNPETDIGYPWIGLKLYKFSNLNQANQSFEFLNNEISESIDPSKENTSPNVNLIGNESEHKVFENVDGMNYKTKNVTFSYIIFRVKNVVIYLFTEGLPSQEINYSQITFDYAQIIEDNINSIINKN